MKIESIYNPTVESKHRKVGKGKKYSYVQIIEANPKKKQHRKAIFHKSQKHI